MMLPGFIGENFLDDFFNGFSLPDAPKARGERGPLNRMRTDIRETEDSYIFDIDLPGFSKDDLKIQLKDGYLAISATTTANNDTASDNDKYIRKERYTGTVSRRFYIGENYTDEDIKAKFDNGLLSITLPKEAPQKVEETKYISIQ
ncbi:MAG: Hsp20/alpha crystallin family protein [Lachnospiraceae bacterium]|nr:Hsp20/alpha crystallin family protein [Lachnospiraceae bacterium]